MTESDWVTDADRKRDTMSTSNDATAKLVRETIQEHGGCGVVSPDGTQVCIKDAKRCPPHGWESDDVVERIVADLTEHFADLDDQEDAVFGEFARVTVVGNVLIVLHSNEPWGVEITVNRIVDG